MVPRTMGATAPNLETLRRYAVARSLFAADLAARRDRTPRLRPGGPDPRARPRAGPDAPPPRRRLPRRRSRAPLREARDRGGLLRQLRLPAAREPRADAPSPRRDRARRAAGAARSARWSPSCASEARRIHGRSTRASRTAASRTGSAARRPRPRSSSTPCTTAARSASLRRESGVRVYALREPTPPAGGAAERRARLDALVDVAVRAYAPLPAATLAYLVSRLRFARAAVEGRPPPARCERARSASPTPASTVDWYWPADETLASAAARPGRGAPARALRSGGLGSAPLRILLGLGLSLRGVHARGAAPPRLLRAAAALARSRDRLGQRDAGRAAGSERELGYVAGRAPREGAFRRALERELERMALFLAPREGDRESGTLPRDSGGTLCARGPSRAITPSPR